MVWPCDTLTLFSNLIQVVNKAMMWHWIPGIYFDNNVGVNICNMWQVAMTYCYNQFLF